MQPDEMHAVDHQLHGLVLGDLRRNLRVVRAVVGPGVGQILGAQGGVGPQQIGLARPELAGLDEHPHRDARAHNTRLAAAQAGRGLDARERIAQVAHDPLEQLGLLGAGYLLSRRSISCMAVMVITCVEA